MSASPLTRRDFLAGSLAASVLAAKPGESIAEDRNEGSRLQTSGFRKRGRLRRCEALGNS